MNLIPSREIGAFEAKNKLGTLLDWVESGEEVTITRRGKAVARLVSVNVATDAGAGQRAADALRASTAGWRLAGLSVNQLKAEGRR